MLFRAIYTCFLQGYYLAMHLAAFFNPKAKQWVKGRKQISADLENLKQNNKAVIWFHCASVGEFEQAIPLISCIENDYPAYQILVSFFSPSGYNYAKKRFPAYTLCYLPYDTPSACRYFIRKVRPKAAFFIKYEFWYNMLHTCQKMEIPLFLVDGIFRPKQIFFSRFGKWFKPVLIPFTHFFLQDERSASLLEQVGITNYSIAGDTRFDRVQQISLKPLNDEVLLHFCSPESRFFIAGSVWDSDIPALKEIIQALPENTKIIIAPHQPGHFKTDWIFTEYITYTQYNTHTKANILILDTIGLLASIYRFAHISYVGGAFGKGLHNILEATVYGHPVIIGPNYSKFKEAVDLVELGAAWPISPNNAGEKTQALWNKAESIEPILKHYFEKNTNVSDKIMVFLKRGKWL